MRKGCSSKVDARHSFITRKFSVLSLFSCESWRLTEHEKWPFSHLKCTAKKERKPKVLPQKALSNPHRAMWYFVIFLVHFSMQLLFSSMPDLIRRKHWCVCGGQKENPITRHTKAWATHLTGGSRCYLSTPPSTPISSSPAGVIRWQDSPNMSGIISHRIFCNSPPPFSPAPPPLLHGVACNINH